MIKISYRGEKYTVRCDNRCAIYAAYSFAYSNNNLVNGYYETTDPIVPVLIKFINGDITLRDVDDKLNLVNWLIYYFADPGRVKYENEPANIRDILHRLMDVELKYTDYRALADSIAEKVYEDRSGIFDLYIDDEEAVITFHYDTEPHTKILKWDMSLYVLYSLNPEVRKESSGITINKKSVKINRGRRDHDPLSTYLSKYLDIVING